MARRDNAHLWPSRPWNQPAGRVVDWVKRYNRSGSHTARQALRWSYLVALADAGEVATHAAVKAAGLTLPGWLLVEARAAAPERVERVPLLPARIERAA